MKEVQRIANKEAVVIGQREGDDKPFLTTWGYYTDDRLVDSASGKETIECHLMAKGSNDIGSLKLEDWNGDFYSCYNLPERICKRRSVPRIKICEVRILADILLHNCMPEVKDVIILHCLFTREHLIF